MKRINITITLLHQLVVDDNTKVDEAVKEYIKNTYTDDILWLADDIEAEVIRVED